MSFSFDEFAIRTCNCNLKFPIFFFQVFTCVFNYTMFYEKVQNIDQWLFVLILFLLRVVQICDILWMTEWIIDLLGPCICFSSQKNILSININLWTALIFCGVKIIVCHKILNFNKIVMKKKTQTLRKVSHWQFECIGDRIKCHILVFGSQKIKLNHEKIQNVL